MPTLDLDNTRTLSTAIIPTDPSCASNVACERQASSEKVRSIYTDSDFSEDFTNVSPSPPSPMAPEKPPSFAIISKLCRSYTVSGPGPL